MESSFTDTDRAVLLELHETVPLVNALCKYCELKSQEAAQSCVAAMMRVPPQIDLARNHAAESKFNDEFMPDLLRFIEKV